MAPTSARCSDSGECNEPSGSTTLPRMIIAIAASCALSALTIFAIAANPTIAPPAVAVATPAAPSDDVVIRTGLALVSPSPRSASRSLVRRDPIEAQLVAGTFVTEGK